MDDHPNACRPSFTEGGVSIVNAPPSRSSDERHELIICLGNPCRSLIDFLGSIKSSDAKTEAGAGFVLRQSDAQQDVAGMGGSGGASRAAADGELRYLEHQRLPFDAR